MTEVEESGHHDLCFLSDPCSQEVPDHGFCSRQSTFCIHCERECICERLEQAENEARSQEAKVHAATERWSPLSHLQGQRDAIAAAVQRVEALIDPWPNTSPGLIRRGNVFAAIKGDQP